MTFGFVTDHRAFDPKVTLSLGNQGALKQTSEYESARRAAATLSADCSQR